jgi:hypothetical protein
MSANDSADGLVTARGRSYGRALVVVCGGFVAMFLSAQATTLGMALLRTWYLETLSTMFVSTTVMAQAGDAAPKLNAEIDQAVDIDNSDTPAASPSVVAALHR